MDTLLRTARRGHPGLFWTGIAMVALTAGLLVLAVLDQRELLGAPLWFKPLKFAISFAFYLLALAWLLGRLPRPALRWTGWAIVAASVIEIVIIAGQAARGERSHFNDDGGIGTALFGVMGAAAAGLMLLTAAIGVRFLRERAEERDLASAIRFGLGLSLVGMVSGILMSINGGHAVGVADGGPGLPLLGWSTTGGDLRVAHFVGLHAVQAMPLLVAVLAGWAPRLDLAARLGVVRVVGTGYLGLVLLLTWQALRGQPLLAPDLVTLVTLGVLLAGTAVGLRATLRGRPAPAGTRVPATAGSLS